MPKSLSFPRIKWFQLSVIISCLLLLGILLGSVFFAYYRQSGFTGVDTGDIAQIRESVQHQKEQLGFGSKKER